MTDKKLAIIFILLAAFCAGGTAPFAKVAMHTIPPMTFIFFRFFLGSLVISVFLYKERKSFVKPTLIVTLLTLIQVVNPIIYTYGVRLTTATISQIVFSTVPIMTAILTFFLFKDKLPLQKIIGIVIGFIGAMIIIFLPVLEAHSVFSGNLLGNFFIVISAICLTVYSIFSKRFHKVYSPLYLTAYFIYITAFISGLLAIPELIKYPSFWYETPLMGWIGVLYAGIIGVLFFLFYQYAVKYGTPTIASVTNYVSPVITFLFAAVLLGERLTFGFMVGALFAFVGVFLVSGKQFSKK